MQNSVLQIDTEKRDGTPRTRYTVKCASCGKRVSDMVFETPHIFIEKVAVLCSKCKGFTGWVKRTFFHHCIFCYRYWSIKYFCTHDEKRKWYKRCYSFFGVWKALWRLVVNPL